MEIDIKCVLPFAWCAECAELDLETVDEYSAIGGARRQYACKNAAYCEACEEAREYKKQEPDAAADDEWKEDALAMMRELDEKISRLRTMNASADELQVMNASADEKPWEILGEDPYTEVADIIEDWCKRNKNFYVIL